MDFRSTLQVVPDADALAQACVSHCHAVAQRAVETHGRFVFVLTGGSSPLPSYTELTQGPRAAEFPWAHTELLWGDERDVELARPESNAGAALRAGFELPSVSSLRMHPMVQQVGSVERSAQTYEALLDSLGGAMDLVLLGLGADGHILSMYPHCPELQEASRRVVGLRSVPMQPALDRVSFTPRALDGARSIVLLVTGAAKGKALGALVREADGSIPALPARLLRRFGTKLTILVDRVAMDSAGL